MLLTFWFAMGDNLSVSLLHTMLYQKDAVTTGTSWRASKLMMTSRGQEDGLPKVKVNKQKGMWVSHRVRLFNPSKLQRDVGRTNNHAFHTASENMKGWASCWDKGETNRMRPPLDVPRKVSVSPQNNKRSHGLPTRQIHRVELKQSYFDFVFFASSQDSAVQQLHEVQFDLRRTNERDEWCC